MKRLTTMSAAALAMLLALPAPARADDPGAYTKSYTLETQGRPRKALGALDAVSTAGKKTYFYNLRRAWLLYSSGDYQASIKSYRKASSLAPKAIEPLLGMMLPQMALRLWSDTADTARKVLRLDPKNYLARSRLAYSLYNLGRYADAEAAYRAVLEGYPGDIEMKAGLGWALLKQGKTAEAVRVFDAILAVAPAHASANTGARAIRAQ